MMPGNIIFNYSISEEAYKTAAVTLSSMTNEERGTIYKSLEQKLKTISDKGYLQI